MGAEGPETHQRGPGKKWRQGKGRPEATEKRAGKGGGGRNARPEPKGREQPRGRGPAKDDGRA